MLGKTHRPEMRAILDDYVKRISRSCPISKRRITRSAAPLKPSASAARPSSKNARNTGWS